MPKNSGQGAARNKGLDNVRPGTEYVAFLDSDDEWTEDHLSNAVNALDAGHDFYFSDFYQLAQTVSAFTRAKRINPSNHRALAGQTNLHVFESDMFSQIIVGNVLGMSTIVYRVSCAPDLRFREDFRSCGEEYLFWCSLSKRTSRIAFSSNIECTYGPGVNTFSGATFGRDGAIRRVHDEIRYLKAIRLEYACTPQQSRHLRRRIHTMRTDFVRELLHRLARGRSLEPKLCWSIVKMDPLCVPLSAPIAARVALDAAKSQIMGSRARNGP
jgi:succinoglycan biosynthesis protein ExoW